MELWDWNVANKDFWSRLAKSLHSQKVSVTWEEFFYQKLALVLVPEKMSWATTGIMSIEALLLSGIQFTKRFIWFVFVETNQFISDNPNVILTRQACIQRSGMAVGSKRQALASYFYIRICYMFLISKCRAKSDLGLCTTYAGRRIKFSKRKSFSILRTLSEFESWGNFSK